MGWLAAQGALLAIGIVFVDRDYNIPAVFSLAKYTHRLLDDRRAAYVDLGDVHRIAGLFSIEQRSGMGLGRIWSCLSRRRHTSSSSTGSLRNKHNSAYQACKAFFRRSCFA